jgi:dephospho-CoA kinase
MLKVGITGGIGSGKSTVARLFQLLGVPVYFADDAAKELMNTNEELRGALIKNFGETVYENGQLNRARLAATVFNKPELLALLNSLVHPIVIADATAWIQKQNAPLVMKEAAIFFESGSYVEMDFIIGVYAPESIRIKRVMLRDGADEKAIRERMSRQMNEEEKMKRCDFVLHNDEETLLIPQVIMLYKKLAGLSTKN